ncbi:MAG: hypothetical protein QF371_08835 [Flavobacteriales bacterium]|jgi:hypothetical protein|nr:hypothetical protein [Flavobacteriales bacterium]
MKNLLPVLFIISVLSACKNNGQNTSSSSKITEEHVSVLQEIIVGQQRKPSGKPDFSVLDWTAFTDTLRVIVSYSGGCEEHDFNAYFSGGWLKSLPPQALIELEHLNPNNDACRSLVKDTLYFDMKSIRYKGQNTVMVKWSGNGDKGGKEIRYSY